MSDADPRRIEGVSALSVLRRGMAASPELRVGLPQTVAMAMSVAGGKLLVPLLIQAVMDLSITNDGIHMGRAVALCVGATVLVVASIQLGKVTYFRLVRTAENVLLGLRVRTFEHLHRLSLAEHTTSRKGVLTARVTSDVETLTQFAQWGAIAWIIDSVQIVTVLIIMAVYSWQLTVVVLVLHLPLLPILRWMQSRQLVAYEDLRTRVSDTLGIVSESVHGVEVVRAYGHRESMRGRVRAAIDSQFDQQMKAARYFSLILPLSDVFGVTAIAAVIGAGVWWGDAWGVSSGQLVAFIFLCNLLVAPISELGEVLDQTQTALAGWWKILDVLDTEVDLIDPSTPLPLPVGALAVRAEAVEFRYRTGGPVLHGIDVDLAAGASVAVVGETGSGKTTFARLLTRLADPTGGRMRVGGVDLRDASPEDRRRSIRMVPQDGFLFDTSVAQNIRYGRVGATDADVIDAVEALGLTAWVSGLVDGIDTRVGERGEGLSVGERQLVALARAQLADPGLLVLDEATSAVDPETETTLERAMERLAAGRTTVSVAHRLSTAERSDLVLVFDDGRIVESGPHTELVERGGVYAGLYASWLGGTRQLS
ncbi:MAG: ABC transporter ATP-binding protein [Acidimicrobiales bacterium]|nr:ABC transporter ATP-binding protein [Actinomycetes bacterium]MDP6159559.1 ABC transporter ATP-binding protein [Acidimicrobiales bacterium]MDP6287420.1 ABC transporter ATP-binding protein [Acidimicrobiales bacterium]MDP6910242.1 ABC transporter ATP-binding protein [Acidimicrobiales bacterium]HJM72272.1 ABC transporter ATP-binding protein [Acidimicrobiales bacterium]